MLKILLTLATGEAAARAIHVLAFVLLARLAGQQALGEFGFALAVSSYLLIAVQQGFDTLAVREVARDPSLLRRYASAIIGLRLTAATFVAAIVSAYAVVSDVKASERMLLAIFMVMFFSGSISLKWVFQALERPNPIAVGGTLAQLCFLAGVLTVQVPADVVRAAAGLVIGEAAYAVVLLVAIQRQAGLILPTLNTPLWKQILRQSWPISISLILGNLLYNFDFFALRAFGHVEGLGLYIASYRCVTVFTLLLGLTQISIFPTVSRTFPDRAATIAITRRLSLYCAAGMLVPAALLIAFAPVVMTHLYGPSYRDGAILVRVLALTLPILGVRTVLRVVVFAYHRQRDDVWNVFWGVVTSVILDLALIPVLGPLACAISCVCAEMVVMVLTWISWFRATHASAPECEQALSASA